MEQVPGSFGMHFLLKSTFLPFFFSPSSFLTSFPPVGEGWEEGNGKTSFGYERHAPCAAGSGAYVRPVHREKDGSVALGRRYKMLLRPFQNPSHAQELQAHLPSSGAFPSPSSLSLSKRASRSPRLSHPSPPFDPSTFRPLHRLRTSQAQGAQARDRGEGWSLSPVPEPALSRACRRNRRVSKRAKKYLVHNSHRISSPNVTRRPSP